MMVNGDFLAHIKELANDEWVSKNEELEKQLFSLFMTEVCPSCKKGYSLENDGGGFYRRPHFCPNCGFNLWKHEEEERQKWLEENPRCQLFYDFITADFDCGVSEHPIEQMKLLGYEIIDYDPAPTADGWVFTVDKFIEPLPKYLRKIRYEVGRTK